MTYDRDLVNDVTHAASASNGVPLNRTLISVDFAMKQSLVLLITVLTERSV